MALPRIVLVAQAVRSRVFTKSGIVKMGVGEGMIVFHF